MRRMIVSVTLLVLAGIPLAAGAQEPPPTTGFEDSNGASWTTHQQELDFLAEVDERSERVEIDVIGETRLERPLHLVRIGHPLPRGLEAAQSEPTSMFVCTQHGNEPAGREACLKLIRDLAFTEDPTLIEWMSTQTLLLVPTANPDGRANNSRGNSRGTDINRDHMALATEEGQTMAAVVRDWTPDLSMDWHEYGPGTPVLYDDEILYLWPRNLNVESDIHRLARSFALDHLEPCAEAGGYSADEYGLDKVSDIYTVRQTAGNEDEGIMRNAMGLRHSLGILIESAVTANPTNNAGEEVASGAANNRRRVDSQRHVMDCSIEWMIENGDEVMAATTTAPLRKEGEGFSQNVPVYFGGADNDPPEGTEAIYPPQACAYLLSAAEFQTVANTLALHGIVAYVEEDGTYRVPMGQPAEPLIPLLLDARGTRKILSATRLDAPPLDRRCTHPLEETAGSAASEASVPFALIGGLVLAGAARRFREG